MNKNKSTLRSFYIGGITAITIFALLISAGLSIVFWLSFSTTPFLSLLFILFALVFESTKNYALIESYLEKNWGKKTLKLSFYTLLTIISIIGTAGGLNSLLEQNENHATNQSLEYQQYNQQIIEAEKLIDSDRMLAQSDLTHNYRTNANKLLTIEIPRLEKNITALQQHKKNLSEHVTNPTSLAITILPIKNAKISLLITLALLIDLLAAFLIGLCFSKQKLNKIENLSENTSEKQEAIDEVIEYNDNIPGLKHATDKKTSALKSIADDLLIRVRENIKNQVYEPKVTKVMAFEQIGYSKAKKVLAML